VIIGKIIYFEGVKCCWHENQT